MQNHEEGGLYTPHEKLKYVDTVFWVSSFPHPSTTHMTRIYNSVDIAILMSYVETKVYLIFKSEAFLSLGPVRPSVTDSFFC